MSTHTNNPNVYNQQEKQKLTKGQGNAREVSLEKLGEKNIREREREKK